MSNDHFLDANILVGSKITWDSQYNSAVKYMAISDIKRHTSKRVYDESKGVFEGSRRLILNYLKKFYEKFNTPQNPMQIDKNIRKFTEKYGVRLTEKKHKILNSFVERNFMEIRNIALGGENELGDFKKIIIDTFKYAINSIDKDCQPVPEAVICRYDGCPLHYNFCYDEEYTNLCEAMKYENDALVLLDAYFMKNNQIKNNLYFVTYDKKHILNNKSAIENILTGITVTFPPR